MTLMIEAMPVPLEVDAHGVVRVGGTRVTLDTVIAAYRRHDSPEQIAESYDVLQLADVYAVISYYLQHRAEVDAYLEQRAREAEALRREIEQRFDQVGFRERLLVRRAEREKLTRDPSDRG